MDRFNNGLIYTNEDCIACNKCINQCAILGANVSVFKDGVSHIKINADKCNNCGKCINLCTQNARHYRDDTEAFLKALENGEKISVIFAPSFFLLYKDRAEKIIGYLKDHGVEKVYDGGFGAEIAIWASVKYIKETQNLPRDQRAFIANACPSFINVAQKYHPFLLRKIIPVHSPLLCTAIYAHKYLGDTNTFAFIGPCVAKKDEITSEETGGNIKYNVTFAELLDKIPRSEYARCKGKVDLPANNFGKILPKVGSFAFSIAQFFPRGENVMDLVGFSKENIDKLYMALDTSNEELQPLVADVMGCADGCINGPGRGKDIPDLNYIFTEIGKVKKQIYEEEKDAIDLEKSWKRFSHNFKDLIPSDFERKYRNLSRQPFHVPQASYDEIFSDMLKNTPKKQNLNCGSCGYSSCREMATAIACGYNKKENCIHYMNDLMTQRLMVDEETGLMSRIAFVKNAEELLLNNPDKIFLFAVGDVNKLRVINDLYGYEPGSSVLKMIGAILKQICGESGIVARLGSGMFCMCLENSVENIQKLQQLKVFDCNSIGIKIPVTMRFGLYMTETNDTVTRAIDRASLCMDKKVSTIQNTFTVFTSEVSDNMYREAELTSKMQKALDNGEFKVWFQPQYSATTGELLGAEALCRWIDDSGKIISPGVFIPIAEKNGFIRHLDKEIWRIAFSKVRQWIDEGIEPIPISLNISRISLQTDAFIYVIRRLGDEFKVPEEYIHFEITESAYISEEGALSERIEQVRKLGYQIAMDDFGNGYSSLNALKDLNFDILKLDMGFVRGTKNTDKGSAIINYVIHMAQSLNLKTVAEGVEFDEQADFLRSVGVNIIQGFLYSKPMPETDFYDLLKVKTHADVKEHKVPPEIMEVKNFFDPDSIENKMFEIFIGPAVIFEYDEKEQTVNVVRMNKKFIQRFNLQNLAIPDAKKQLKKCIEKDSANLFIQTVQKAMETHAEQTISTQHIQYKTKEKFSLKLTVNEMESVDQKKYVYALVEG